MLPSLVFEISDHVHVYIMVQSDRMGACVFHVHIHVHVHKNSYLEHTTSS